MSFRYLGGLSEESNRPLTRARRRIVAARWQHGSYAASSDSDLHHQSRRATSGSEDGEKLLCVRRSSPVGLSHAFARLDSHSGDRREKGKHASLRVASLTDIRTDHHRGTALDFSFLPVHTFATDRSGERRRAWRRSRDDVRDPGPRLQLRSVTTWSPRSAPRDGRELFTTCPRVAMVTSRCQPRHVPRGASAPGAYRFRGRETHAEIARVPNPGISERDIRSQNFAA